jgi:hypothetical protein
MEKCESSHDESAIRKSSSLQPDQYDVTEEEVQHINAKTIILLIVCSNKAWLG